MGYTDGTCVVSDLGIQSGCRVYGIFLAYLDHVWHPVSGLIPGVYQDGFVPDIVGATDRKFRDATLALMRADVVDYLAPASAVTTKDIEVIALSVEAGRQHPTTTPIDRLMRAFFAGQQARELDFSFGSYLYPDARHHLWLLVIEDAPENYKEWVRLSTLFLAVNHLLARGWFPKPVTVGVQDSRQTEKYRADYHKFLSCLNG